MKKLPEILTDQERESLLNTPNRKCPTGLRNVCVMTLMVNAGLRAAECLDLKANDIDWNSGKLMVRDGKGGKDRALWISDSDLELLKSWLAIKPTSEYLFATLEGKHLDTRYLREMVKREARQAGIQKDVHPHMLRHTFATDLFKETKNIRLTQKALGHSSISTTMIYTHIVDEELENGLKNLRAA